MTQQSPGSNLEFPCRFPIKAFGHDHPDFPEIVFELVRKHAQDTTAEDMRSNNSRNGRYLAVTITINATSQVQLDNIYNALTAHELVVMAL